MINSPKHFLVSLPFSSILALKPQANKNFYLESFLGCRHKVIGEKAGSPGRGKLQVSLHVCPFGWSLKRQWVRLKGIFQITFCRFWLVLPLFPFLPSRLRSLTLHHVTRQEQHHNDHNLCLWISDQINMETKHKTNPVFVFPNIVLLLLFSVWVLVCGQILIEPTNPNSRCGNSTVLKHMYNGMVNNLYLTSPYYPVLFKFFWSPFNYKLPSLYFEEK